MRITNTGIYYFNLSELVTYTYSLYLSFFSLMRRRKFYSSSTRNILFIYFIIYIYIYIYIYINYIILYYILFYDLKTVNPIRNNNIMIC